MTSLVDNHSAINSDYHHHDQAMLRPSPSYLNENQQRSAFYDHQDFLTPSSPQTESESNHTSKLLATSTFLLMTPSIYNILPISMLSPLPLMTAAVFLISPIPQFKQIITTKSTGNLCPMPYLSMFSNAIIWTEYGVLCGDPTVLSCNVAAMMSSAICMTIFIANNSDPNNMRKIKKFAALSSIGLTALTATALSGISGDALLVLGTVGTITNIFMACSPLSVLPKIIKQRSTASLPFGLCGASTIHCLNWACYGHVVMDDMNIWLPSIVGFAAGLTQLSLFAIF